MAEKFPFEEYFSAVRGEQEDRAIAFLELKENICGIEVEPLTLLKIELLRIAGSPFIVGGIVSETSIIQFLWIVCSNFVPNPQVRDEWIAAHPIDFQKARTEIDDYLDRAFLDSVGGGGRQKTVVSMCATIAHCMAGEPYRMNWREVLRTPVAVLFQLLKADGISRGVAPLVNKRSDRISSAYAERKTKANLRKMKREQKKEKANG